MRVKKWRWIGTLFPVIWVLSCSFWAGMLYVWTERDLTGPSFGKKILYMWKRSEGKSSNLWMWRKQRSSKGGVRSFSHREAWFIDVSAAGDGIWWGQAEQDCPKVQHRLWIAETNGQDRWRTEPYILLITHIVNTVCLTLDIYKEETT